MDCWDKAQVWLDQVGFQQGLVATEVVLEAWTYYVYVVFVCLRNARSLELATLLAVYNFLFFMCLWCYVRTVLATRIAVPPEFHFTPVQWYPIERDANLQMRTRKELRVMTTNPHAKEENALNYCYHCNVVKPDRCHHCSRCKACVLRMDHHCPWMSRCVGFHNHKFFLLFLHYTFAYCIFLIITCTGMLPRMWRRDTGDWVHIADIHGQERGVMNEVDEKTDSFLTLADSRRLFDLTNNSISDIYNGTASTIEFTTTTAATTPTTTATSTTANAVRNTTAHVAISPIAERIVIPRVSTIVRGGEAEGAEAEAGGTKTSQTLPGTGLSLAFLQVLAVVILHLVLLTSLFPLLHVQKSFLAANMTTLESFRPVALLGQSSSTTIFDLGSVAANHREIMGPEGFLWLLPIFTSLGDGVHFPVRNEEEVGRYFDVDGDNDDHNDRAKGDGEMKSFGVIFGGKKTERGGWDDL